MKRPLTLINMQTEILGLRYEMEKLEPVYRDYCSMERRLKSLERKIRNFGIARKPKATSQEWGTTLATIRGCAIREIPYRKFRATFSGKGDVTLVELQTFFYDTLRFTPSLAKSYIEFGTQQGDIVPMRDESFRVTYSFKDVMYHPQDEQEIEQFSLEERRKAGLLR